MRLVRRSTGAVDDVTINLSLSDGDGGSDSKTKTVTVSNVAPTLSAISGDASANEGDGLHTYTFSFTDPGADFWTASVSCGTNGTDSALSIDQTAKTGTFKCAWSDDPTGAVDDVTINLSLSDGDGGSDSKTKTVTVSNVAPVVTITAAPASANEGESKSFTFGWSDPGADAWIRTISCGTWGELDTNIFNQTTKTGSFPCTWGDDDHCTASDNVSVSVTVNDDDGGSDTETTTVSISNLNPVRTASTFLYNPFTGMASATIDYSDPGWRDTHTADLQLGRFHPARHPVAGATTRPDATGRFRFEPRIRTGLHHRSGQGDRQRR